MLDCIEIETAADPDAAVIWLHGLGADAGDFEPVVPALVQPKERAWRFVFPNAPIRPITLNNGMPMRAWYDIKGLGQNAEPDAAGFAQTAGEIGALIEREGERGIPAERVVLAGFSQGGASSLYLLSRFPKKLAGIVALSCYLPMQRTLLAERVAANDSTPIFMAHGTLDPMLPVGLGNESRDLLRQLGYRVQWHEYPIPHSVSDQEIRDIRAFLLATLS